VADFLPFNKLMADGITIRCYNGSFARVFKVEGVDLSFVTDEKSLSMMEARKSWIDSMSDLQVVCRVITLRERISMEADSGDFGNQLLEQISMTWRNNLDRVYSNGHYIVLSVADRPEALKDLNYASQALLATLNDYGVKPMFETEDSAAADSPLAIFSKICSPLSKPMPKVRGAEGYQLNELLTADHIHFTDEKGLIKFFSGDKEMFAIVMGIRSSGDYMDEGMIASLLSIDCELTMLHNVKPIFKPHARALLMQQQRMAAVTSFSPDVINQYSEALSAIEDSDADYQALNMPWTLLSKAKPWRKSNSAKAKCSVSAVFSALLRFGRAGWLRRLSLTSFRLMTLIRALIVICRGLLPWPFLLTNRLKACRRVTGVREPFPFSAPLPVRLTVSNSMFQPKIPLWPTVALSDRPDKVKPLC